jgi:hypothetical protein
MHDWQWVDDHHDCKQGPDEGPHCRFNRRVKCSTDLVGRKPKTVDERGEQESGDFEVFAVVYTGENIEL